MSAALVLAAGIVVAVDQISKRLAVCHYARRHTQSPRRPAGLTSNVRAGLILVTNIRVLYLLWGLAALAAFLLVTRVPTFQAPVPQMALGAALGGAAGNLLDIVRRRTVVDFIDLRVWPTFNVADSAIVFGLICVLWAIW